MNKRNENRPGYGLAKVGWIPDGWQAVKLGNIGHFTKGAGILKDQVVETGYNAVRYGELYTIHNFQIKKVHSHIPKNIISSTKKIKFGDILFAGSGETIDEIGKSAAYLLDEDCYAGGDIIIFTPKNVDSLFLSYFLNVGEARKKLRELGQGQSVVHIYKRDLENLKLHLPPLPEQKRIVGVLEVWDEAIEKLARKIEVKKNIKKGLMQQLLTGKKRLHGFSGEWPKRKLGELYDITSSKRVFQSEWKSEGIPFYRAREIVKLSENGFVNNELFISEEMFIAYKVKYGAPKVNDLLVTGVGTIGVLYRVKNEDEFYFKDGNIIWLKDKGLASSNYIEQLFSTSFIKKQILGSSPITTVATYTIDIAKKTVVLLPSLSEQTAIAKILTIADDEIAQLERKLSLIKQQKKYLLNKLVTGAIRTPETICMDPRVKPEDDKVLSVIAKER